MSVTVIKATLKSGKFRQHKKNPKGNTLIFSRNHPTESLSALLLIPGLIKTQERL